MKITVKQLKQLIREQVEEIAQLKEDEFSAGYQAPKYKQPTLQPKQGETIDQLRKKANELAAKVVNLRMAQKHDEADQVAKELNALFQQIG